jgi:hypothetical protein
MTRAPAQQRLRTANVCAHFFSGELVRTVSVAVFSLATSSCKPYSANCALTLPRARLCIDHLPDLCRWKRIGPRVQAARIGQCAGNAERRRPHLPAGLRVFRVLSDASFAHSGSDLTMLLLSLYRLEVLTEIMLLFGRQSQSEMAIVVVDDRIQRREPAVVVKAALVNLLRVE